MVPAVWSCERRGDRTEEQTRGVMRRQTRKCRCELSRDLETFITIMCSPQSSYLTHNVLQTCSCQDQTMSSVCDGNMVLCAPAQLNHTHNLWDSERPFASCLILFVRAFNIPYILFNSFKYVYHTFLKILIRNSSPKDVNI